MTRALLPGLFDLVKVVVCFRQSAAQAGEDGQEEKSVQLDRSKIFKGKLES